MEISKEDAQIIINIIRANAKAADIIPEVIANEIFKDFPQISVIRLYDLLKRLTDFIGEI